ncbi:MAG: hypothetical protein WKG07_14275 [Hymenobacter sp.]
MWAALPPIRAGPGAWKATRHRHHRRKPPHRKGPPPGGRPARARSRWRWSAPTPDEMRYLPEFKETAPGTT